MTVQNLVERALTQAGKLGAGRGAAISESAVALNLVNGLIDNWNQQRSYVFGLDAVSQPLTPGVSTYTLTVRPIHIETAEIVTTAGGAAWTQSLAILGPEEWAAVPDKGAVTPFPKALFCDYGIPTAKVQIAPAPQTGTLQLKTWAQIAKFTALTDVVALTQGVERALINNLAVELCAAYSLPVSQALVAIATESHAALAKLNLSHGSAPRMASGPSGAAA